MRAGSREAGAGGREQRNDSPPAGSASAPGTLAGYGIGLRKPHYPEILGHWPAIDWFEIISENFMVPGGRPLYVLEQVRCHYPIALHGVSLSIGSTDPLDLGYLRRLKELAARFEPAWISDHLCWTGAGGHNLHDLLPLPYTEETIDHVARRVAQVQDLLGCRILLENVSSYLEFRVSSMPEWEFLAAVAQQADCHILLDVNNIYVSARNHDFDPVAYLRHVPTDRVRQFHLAGYSDRGTFLHDTHDHPVSDPVWQLYAEAVRRFGALPALVEWDDNLPPLHEVVAQADRARGIAAAIAHESTESTRYPAAPGEADRRA